MVCGRRASGLKYLTKFARYVNMRVAISWCLLVSAVVNVVEHVCYCGLADVGMTNVKPDSLSA